MEENTWLPLNNKLEYNTGCMESMPCQHYVRDKKTGQTKSMYIGEIYKLAIKSGLNITENYGCLYTKWFDTTHGIDNYDDFVD